MNETLQRVYEIGIIPVIAIEDAAQAVPLARALVAGGLPAAEITFRTAAAEDAIRAIVKEVPEMLVAGRPGHGSRGVLHRSAGLRPQRDPARDR